MAGAGKTKTLSVHKFRRTAQDRERELTQVLDTAQEIVKNNPEPQVASAIGNMLEANGIPEWARGVRVEKAGMFSYSVVATEHKGH
jgi:hypothetical protein